MSVSDYTTFGEIPVENKGAQGMDKDKESYAAYHLYVKKYPVFLIILSLLTFIFSIVAICYFLFIPMEKKYVISGVLMFFSVLIFSLCYLIDAYLEYKSWSIFGEQVHNTNVKAWDGEHLEYPELHKFNHSLTNIALPSCVLLEICSVLLFLFSSPMEGGNDNPINETETTTIIVPNEDEEISNGNSAPPVVNNPPVIIDDNPQNNMNNQVIPETPIISSEILENPQSNRPSVSEENISSKNNSVTSQVEETPKNDNTANIKPNDNDPEPQDENGFSNNQTVENHLPEENNSIQPKDNSINNNDGSAHSDNPVSIVDTENIVEGQGNE